jgi:hypothetical protein
MVLPTLPAIGRIHSEIVIARQMQWEAIERIALHEGLPDPASKAIRAEAIEDLTRARQTEAKLRKQLAKAYQDEDELRAMLQDYEGMV